MYGKPVVDTVMEDKLVLLLLYGEDDVQLPAGAPYRNPKFAFLHKKRTVRDLENERINPKGVTKPVPREWQSYIQYAPEGLFAMRRGHKCEVIACKYGKFPRNNPFAQVYHALLWSAQYERFYVVFRRTVEVSTYDEEAKVYRISKITNPSRRKKTVAYYDCKRYGEEFNRFKQDDNIFNPKPNYSLYFDPSIFQHLVATTSDSQLSRLRMIEKEELNPDLLVA